MDILIPDSWLRDYLSTKATPKDIAKYLSLSGPSVERIEKHGKELVYHIEVTPNRIDAASVYGIAREAAAILPRYGIKAELKNPKDGSKIKFTKTVDYLDAKVDSTLCPRFTAVLLRDVKIGPSPKDMASRLEAVGERPINNVVDISNYLMHELGQPMHTFDYDKIKKSKMIIRSARKGESVITLDGKTFNLKKGDIVIEDGDGRLIDLAGIMGGKLSEVDESTKNVLLFIQTYNPVNIRKTSMRLAHRTEAAQRFEKGLDTQLVEVALVNALDLFRKYTYAQPSKEVLDIYPAPYKTKVIKTNANFVNKKLGAQIKPQEMINILNSLGIASTLNKKGGIECKVPSYRANDIDIQEDIVEEIARLYGYHNLGSSLMEGQLPQPLDNSTFDFENNLRQILMAVGGVETYTLSLVPESWTDTSKALKLTNPLGKDTQALRTSLKPSLVSVALSNKGVRDTFHVFEIANIYIKRTKGLPEEKLTVAGIFEGYTFRQAKGVLEAILNKLNLNYTVKQEDKQGFAVSQRITINSGNSYLGEFGTLEEGQIYYDLDVVLLSKHSKKYSQFTHPTKYPSHIEDITFVLPLRTRAGDIISFIRSKSKLVKNIELTDIFSDSYTFKLWYSHPRKTLTNKDVEKIRKQIIKSVNKKFGTRVK